VPWESTGYSTASPKRAGRPRALRRPHRASPGWNSHHHHPQRPADLGREFGATEIIAERGEEAVERVRQLTSGQGTRTVLDCVGTRLVLDTAFGAIRDGGVISRAGIPQYTEGPIGMDMLMRNLTLTGGATPARAYMEQLLPDVLDGTIQPGRVFDRTISLDHTPDGYRAMDERQALKILIQP
jgi:hypothetical protein